MEPLPKPGRSMPQGQPETPSWLGRWQQRMSAKGRPEREYRSAKREGTPMSPLARDIIIVLAVKAVVLYGIWFAFFRAPVARHMMMDPKAVEQQVAGPRVHTEPAHAVR